MAVDPGENRREGTGSEENNSMNDHSVEDSRRVRRRLFSTIGPEAFGGQVSGARQQGALTLVLRQTGRRSDTIV